jgi:predicted RNase H-like nuclease (RuvC/YqgF family)
MSSSSTNEFISTILAKPTKTSNDLQQIIDYWHKDLLKNEDYLLQYANQLNQKQQFLNKTTQSFIQTQDLFSNLEENLKQFQISIQTLTKYNDELENNIEQLNIESKTFVPHILPNLKIEHDRSITNELMESVDNDLNQLEQIINELNQRLQINTDNSIIKTTNELQTCFHDIENLQENIKQIKF